MQISIFISGAALIILPMLVASCGGGGTGSDPGSGTGVIPGNDPSLIENSPDPALPGCTTDFASCNLDTTSGAVVQGNDSGSLSIRFYTFKNNLDGTYTYSDGRPGVTLSEAEFVDWWENFERPEGIDYDILAYGFGHHTDASMIPRGGTATYKGGTRVGDDVTVPSAGYWTESGLTDEGTSILTVDFSTLSVDLELDFGPNGEIDIIEVKNMSIDGYSFSGDEVTLYKEGIPVDLTGANTEAGSAGLFGGPIDDVPAWFVAVGVVEGDDDALWFDTDGQSFSSENIVPAN